MASAARRTRSGLVVTFTEDAAIPGLSEDERRSDEAVPEIPVAIGGSIQG